MSEINEEVGFSKGHVTIKSDEMGLFSGIYRRPKFIKGYKRCIYDKKCGRKPYKEYLL